MKKALRIGVTVLVCATLIVSYYYYLSHRNDSLTEESTVTEVSEADAIITRDFSTNYPATPRAVVKWYNRIITEFYAEDHSDSEITALASKQRELLDEELLAKNPVDEFLQAVKADVLEYSARDERIVTSKVCSSNDVTYATVQGDQVAYVTSYYFIREGNDYMRSYQEYCLRKDASGNWKILTFRQIDGDPEDYE